jgi:hypothetical protein
MGLISKQRTKARTAPADHATNLSGEWVTEGMPHMAAIVRAAASSLAAGKDLKSSGFRGHDTLGIGSAIRSGGSTIWVEQAGFGVWAVGLGLATVRGPAFDWQLMFKATLADSGAVSVCVTSPNVLTKDGTQVHKDEYLEVRELVLAGLSASYPPKLGPEVAAGVRGLSFLPAPFAEEPLTPYDGSFSITTRLASDELRGCLARLHFSRQQGGLGAERWLIGLRSVPAPSWIDLTVTDEGGVRALKFDAHLAHNENLSLNVICAHHARRFASCVLGSLRARDETAAIGVGGDLTDGLA